MNTPGKLAAFAAVVAVCFVAAAATGAAVGPIDMGSQSATHAMPDLAPHETDPPRGLAIAEEGHRLLLESASIASGRVTTFNFAIVDDAGRPVTGFEDLHERPMHLILLSRNMVDYLHLHPTMDPNGRWSVDFPALNSGSYRLFADFQPTGGDNITLGADIAVAGAVAPGELPVSGSVSTIDAYTVTLSGAPVVGDSELSFTVATEGQIVRTDPYLGAGGHLVAVRVGDLAYLHVHPNEGGRTPVVTFTAELPTPGTYRLFFDFSHEGTVRTASFTVDVPVGEGAPLMAPHEEGQ